MNMLPTLHSPTVDPHHSMDPANSCGTVAVIRRPICKINAQDVTADILSELEIWTFMQERARKPRYETMESCDNYPFGKSCAVSTPFSPSRVGNSRCNYIVDHIMALLAVNLLILGTNSIMHCAFN